MSSIGAPKKEPVIQKVYIPGDATPFEHRIHDYLNKIGLQTIDLKSTIEQEGRLECKSP